MKSSPALLTAVLALGLAIAPARAFETSPEPLIIETAHCEPARLKKVEMPECPVRFTVELALSQEEHAQGLMNRSEMAADHGMLFEFDETRDVYMWMKNTILPLDMVFIGEDGLVAGVAHDAVPFSETVIASPGPVRYVLELNAGVAAASGIEAGDVVDHPQLNR